VKRLPAVIGSAVFLVIAPGFVAGWMPWYISRWRMQEPLAGLQLFRWMGGMLIVLGAAGLLDCFARFALQGRGTPAPVLPPCHLVVTGLYGYVRNPMYAALMALVLGQGLLLGNVGVLEYGALVWLVAHLFVRLYESRSCGPFSGPNTRPTAPQCRDGFRTRGGNPNWSDSAISAGRSQKG
jgi:protein-S-isoprenylcysteine O-methyltransferase Ste14